MISKSFDEPDEVRSPDKAKVHVLTLDNVHAARMTMQPGWRWSDCIKPIVGGDSCQARHVGVAVSGRLHVKADNGAEVEIGAGDGYVIDPGHDAWVVGDDEFLSYEFESQTAANYAYEEN
jgi:hypothetical protein